MRHLAMYICTILCGTLALDLWCYSSPLSTSTLAYIICDVTFDAENEDPKEQFCRLAMRDGMTIESNMCHRLIVPRNKCNGIIEQYVMDYHVC